MNVPGVYLYSGVACPSIELPAVLDCRTQGRNSVKLGPFLVPSLTSRCCLRLAHVLHATGVYGFAPPAYRRAHADLSWGLERPAPLDMLLHGDSLHNRCRQSSTPYLDKEHSVWSLQDSSEIGNYARNKQHARRRGIFLLCPHILRPREGP